MKPLRRYNFTFSNPTAPRQVKLAQAGRTPCEARNNAFVMLETLLRVSPDLPADGWRLDAQEDNGLME